MASDAVLHRTNRAPIRLAASPEPSTEMSLGPSAAQPRLAAVVRVQIISVRFRIIEALKSGWAPTGDLTRGVVRRLSIADGSPKHPALQIDLGPHVHTGTQDEVN